MPAFERDWDVAKQLASQVFKKRCASCNGSLARQHPRREMQIWSSSPDKFGPLAGKTGLFGHSVERRYAVDRIDPLASYVRQSGKSWQRRLAAEYQEGFEALTEAGQDLGAWGVDVWLGSQATGGDEPRIDGR
ncbi:hypothetical protein [Rhizobium brockwellii]|uniref:hypothetical protein n=1 Tax=Rhizobium brockwellii TaxID=3019932 RepID=UPI003F94E7B0